MVRKSKTAPDGGDPAGGFNEEEDVPVWVIDAEDEEEAAEGEVTAGPAGDGEAADDAADRGEAQRLRKELAEVREQWIRALADLDNYRKRSDREQREQKRYALFEPMRELLPVVDNLERAIAADGPVEDLKRGVEMVLHQLKEVLRGLGVKPVPAAGAPFDPAIHDAVSRHEDGSVEAPTVADELQRGYTLYDRLLRPALVTVAMPAAAQQPAADPSSANED